MEFLKAVKKLPSYEIISAQMLAQRDSVIMRLRKEESKKKIYRLQGRLDQIEEMLSFEENLQLSLASIEKNINAISKGMNSASRE